MLTIPKEYLKAIDRRRTDNPMTKEKGQKNKHDLQNTTEQ